MWATILENSNGGISATDHPIRFMFGSRPGFSGSADRMALVFGLIKSKMVARHWIGRSNGAISSWIKLNTNVVRNCARSN